MMRDKSIPELDKLFLEIGRYRNSDEYNKLLNFVKKFPYTAPYNAMLIHVQKPGSNYVASAYVWRSKFNREINPGANPLVILRPFGPVAFVFELGDTNGREFPKELLQPFKAEGEVSHAVFYNLINNIKTDGILYTEADRGTDSAGFIEETKNKKEEKIVRNKKEIWVKILYDMIVNKNHSPETRFATVIHELGHAYCGHLYNTRYPQWWGERHHLSENEREFEAESVCWLVCERMGIKNPSARYLRGYLKENGEIPNISIDAVLKSAGMIETMIRGSKEPRKEIIVRINEIK